MYVTNNGFVKKNVKRTRTRGRGKKKGGGVGERGNGHAVKRMKGRFLEGVCVAAEKYASQAFVLRRKKEKERHGFH